MGIRDVFFLGVVFVGTATVGAGLLRSSEPKRLPRVEGAKDEARRVEPEPIVVRINQEFRNGWRQERLRPAPPATELTVMRRLSLALLGSVPSLEEIRRFEKRPEGSRVGAWIDELLGDRRFADYLAERLARAFVGTEDGPFVLFRRRRFVAWLSDAILADRPYDAIVRDMIADKGLWTDHPATNFVSVTFNADQGRPDPERLAA